MTGKRLHLLRHAKSSWADPGAGDHERELNQRGRRDAPRMGAALAKIIEPQPVSVSTARRAQATLAGLVEGWPAMASEAHRSEEALYTFSSRELAAWISEQPDGEQSLFIIAHNPGLTGLANWLCGESWLSNLPTAGYVGLKLSCSRWSDIAPGCALLRDSLFPRELRTG